MQKNTDKGQVAIVLVLIMTVVSALAVSLASRATVDTRIQQTESENVQALIFAQTGLEQLIMNPGSTSGSEGGDYFAVSSDVGSEGLDVGRVDKGSTVELNLDPHDGNLTGFTVLWSPDKASPGEQPAMFISLIQNTNVVQDYAFDYTGLNGFSVAGSGTGGYAKSSGVLPLNANVVKVRITSLGAPALIKVNPSGALFPVQIKSIKSTGSVQSSDKYVKYGLQYDESSADTVPAVFDYALFSGGSIVQ